MAKKKAAESKTATVAAGKPSAVVDTRVIYCGDNLEQWKKLPHDKAWSKDGPTTYDNLQTLCSVCNIGKSNLESEEQ